MAYKPNGIFGKDVQVFVDDTVGKILKGDLETKWYFWERCTSFCG